MPTLIEYGQKLDAISKEARAIQASAIALREEAANYKAIVVKEKDRSKLEEISQGCSKKLNEVAAYKAKCEELLGKLNLIDLTNISAATETKSSDKKASEMDSTATRGKNAISDSALAIFQKNKNLALVHITQKVELLELLEQAFTKYQNQANEKLGKPKTTISDKGKFAPAPAAPATPAPSAESKTKPSPAG